jgi:hypothetical protein
VERQSERDRLREQCVQDLRSLREADDDETSDVIAEAAAQAAARTARQITLPDSDAPPRKKAQPAHKVAAAVVTLGACAWAVLEALRQAGVLK